MTAPRIGVRVPPCARADAVAAAVARAEELGFAEAWLPDSQLLWRDVYTTLTAAALSTSRIGLGTAVTNLETRHVAVVASAARSVAELAPGRFTLGIGVGNSSVGPVGLPPSTGARMRDGFTALRALLAGQDVDFNGTVSRLRDPVEVPLVMAASGPRNLRLAGEIADGALLLSGISDATLADAARRVGEGAEAAGRGPVPLVASAFCAVTDDVEKAARRLKPIVAGIAGTGGAKALALAGIELGDVPARIEGVYPDLVHAEDWDRAVEICSRWVSDAAAAAFARSFCLFGTAAEITARLEGLGAAGIAGVYLQHVGSYDLPYELIESVGGEVLPGLRR
ncbi:LLM class flavin-dependent oxidoreductase [Actinocorallia sp. A-T 12471]|uniref:LLM class flavin-dependent oxidoreductase n=1 Tax=Actinocorallia sp. A-T 12471 TaxID=3089813 RepID=UPI0029CDFF62|nr:LLM class flavin-dependent oxidoreductase [Actinocorallia sp. A-T 12471]MDX6741080.1 LLM class flavin-dependent oxidoreductase [Actinocorallia sp. A-T 12471]